MKRYTKEMLALERSELKLLQTSVKVSRIPYQIKKSRTDVVNDVLQEIKTKGLLKAHSHAKHLHFPDF